MMSSKKLISLVSPCYNEEDNVEELFRRVIRVLDEFPQYEFEYILIDNASVDGTVDVIKKLINIDKRIRLIVNNRNFGHIRSPYWAMMQAKGAALIYLASDLQDPPEMVRDFIEKWEQGYKVVMATKPESRTGFFTHALRKIYYTVLDKISETPITRNTTGFGLYDKAVIDQIRLINDPYPYLRGLIDELGYPATTIQFVQPQRYKGNTKNNFYSLYDIAMLGFVSHSMIPLRIASFVGLASGFISLLLAAGLLVAKLIWWDRFSAGLAPIGIATMLMFSILMFSIGILGEYLGATLRYLRRRPIVTELERVNFDE